MTLSRRSREVRSRHDSVPVWDLTDRMSVDAWYTFASAMEGVGLVNTSVCAETRYRSFAFSGRWCVCGSR